MSPLDQPLAGGTAEPSLPRNASLAAAPALPSYRDRSGGLLGFGILLIILGGLASLAIPFILLSALLSRKVSGGGMPAGSYVLTVVSYGLAAVGLITLGVGSIRARRWARALTLVMSWAWLFFGILMTGFLTAVLPASFAAVFHRAVAANPEAAAMPTGVLAVILTCVIVLFAIMFIIVPLVFVLFYRKQDVEETVKHRDPVERWTDRCPLPVLAASLLFGWACLYYVLMSFTTPLIPFFGRYLTGLPGAVGCLLLAMLDAYLAYSLFRLQLAGWWIAITALALQTTSAGLTSAHGDLLQAYSKLGWKGAQLQMMSESPMFHSHLMLWWRVGSLLAFLGYMLWIKRYFHPPPQSSVVEPMPSAT